jgi:hypothetical protein
MPAFLNDRVLDLGLTVLDTEADKIFICSAQPATYAEAITTHALGNKNFGVGGVCGAPAARAPTGRKATTAPVTDGVVTATGAASHYAIVDSVNARLLAANSLASPQAVTAGNAFLLPAFDIGMPGPA